MILRNAQMPLNQLEVDARNILGIRRRSDGTTVILQSIEPTHLHVRDPFSLVCKFFYEEMQGRSNE